MRRVILTLTIAIVTGTMFMMPRDAAAYCQLLTCQKDCKIDRAGCPTGGEPLYWPKMPLVFRFHSRGSRLLVREEARAAIRAAFHRWSDVVCKDGRRTSLRFREDEDVDGDKPLDLTNDRAPEPFGIYFRDFGWPHRDGDATLALTTHLFGKSTGRIEYSDMEINTGAKRFSTDEQLDGTDLQAVITHEVGHYIGLAHSRADQSIMADRYCDAGDDRCEKGKFAARRLAPDDVQAVCDLYPPGGDGITPAEKDGAESDKGSLSPSCAAAPTMAPHRALALSLPGGLVIVVALVRRRRSSIVRHTILGKDTRHE